MINAIAMMRPSTFAILFACLCLVTNAVAQGTMNGNTLVTGVVTDQNGRVPNDPLVLRIYAGKRKLAEVKTSEGLFSCELKGKAASSEVINVVLREQAFDLGDADRARQYGEASSTQTLQKSQNLKLEVKFDYIGDQPVVGPYSEIPAR